MRGSRGMGEGFQGRGCGVPGAWVGRTYRSLGEGLPGVWVRPPAVARWTSFFI